jgi:hypothetical protein
MMDRGGRELRKWLVAWQDLNLGTSSLSGFCARACFPRTALGTWANDAPLETAANRLVPMARGPNVDQAEPLSGPVGLDQWAPGPSTMTSRRTARPQLIALWTGLLPICSTSGSEPWRK